MFWVFFKSQKFPGMENSFPSVLIWTYICGRRKEHFGQSFSKKKSSRM